MGKNITFDTHTIREMVERHALEIDKHADLAAFPQALAFQVGMARKAMVEAIVRCADMLEETHPEAVWRLLEQVEGLPQYCLSAYPEALQARGYFETEIKVGGTD